MGNPHLSSYNPEQLDVIHLLSGKVIAFRNCFIIAQHTHRCTDMTYISLTTMDLKQLITKPTRTTQHSSTLIDHIITNMPMCVTHMDVLPCPLIGDHNAPYITVNVCVTWFQACYKFIWIERGFDREAFIHDFEELPFSIIYSTKDPDLQVSYLNTLITDCLNRHAPLKCVKVTRPPASWMKELDIKQLQQVCQNLRMAAHQDNTEQTWSLFQNVRNRLKIVIKKTKRTFYERLLSSPKPKEVWSIIHRILNPNPRPLRA
jgi:hypothetical protein